MNVDVETFPIKKVLKKYMGEGVPRSIELGQNLKKM